MLKMVKTLSLSNRGCEWVQNGEQVMIRTAFFCKMKVGVVGGGNGDGDSGSDDDDD